jgi:hypothetical protein
MQPQHSTRPIGTQATIVDMTFTSFARIDVERAGRTVRVLIGPTGEALLPAGMTLPPAAHAEVERYAQSRFLQELIELFALARERRVQAQARS